MGQLKYNNELEGQYKFYQDYLPRVDSSLSISSIQNDYNDGVVNGNIIEFKLHIENLNAVLFQVLKYLSSMRIKGKFIPKNIIIVSLNEDRAFIYDSGKYLSDIEKVYFQIFVFIINKLYLCKKITNLSSD